MKSLALFNNKGGVGKTTLTFNLAHMASRLGNRVVVIDYDPQCNLSSIFLRKDELFAIWEADVGSGTTVADCLEPVRRGKGGLRSPSLRRVHDQLWILPGHLSLSRFEQTLAEEWPKTTSSTNERALDVTISLDMLSNLAADEARADLVLIDVGPSLGALNRAALLACDALVLPLAPDLFSLQGMRDVGPTLREWRTDWKTVRERHMQDRDQHAVPPHGFRPVGYVVQQHLAPKDQAVKGDARWAELIPQVFHQAVLDEADSPLQRTIEDDPCCLASIRHFASLVPIAQQSRKPMFDLKQSDGIGGSQIQAVARCKQEFERLVRKITERLEAPLGP